MNRIFSPHRPAARPLRRRPRSGPLAAAWVVLLLAGGFAGDAAAAPLQLGKTVPVRAESGNRAVAVTVRNAALVDAYGDTKAPDGRLFLVLATQWENVLPIKVAAENKGIPTGYTIPDMADHAYVVINGRRVARMVPDAAKLPGHLKTKDFGLAALGDTARGNLVFDVPRDLAASAEVIELHYFDLTHGHFRVDLAGDPAALKDKPLSAPVKNQVLEVGLFGAKREKAFGGRQAPDGMSFVLLDVRARSNFLVEADATAFDPAAKPGAKTQAAIFADWTEWRKYTQLVLDREYAYLPEPGGELPEVPRFLPDVFTGGTIAFLVPDKLPIPERAAADRVVYADLKLNFPNARAGARVLRPAPLSIPFEGRQPNLPKREPLAFVDDDVFKVAVVGQTVVKEFAGAKPPAGQFVVLDVEVQNTKQGGEFFQPKRQVKLVTEQAKEIEAADATFAGPRRPTELVYIPGDERRVFQLAFDAPATLVKPRLSYAGVSLAKVLDLPPIGGGAVAGTTGPAGTTGTAGATTTTQPAVAGKTGATTQPAGVALTPVQPPPMPAGAAADKPKKDALPKRVAAKQPRKPQGLAAAGLTQEEVNAAIDRGAKFLWEHVRKEVEAYKKEPTREHALYLLALVHADYHKKDPACEAAVRNLLAVGDPVRFGTYGAGIYCMLAESVGDGMYLPRVKIAARYLVESQGKGGTWGYNGNRNPKLYEEPAPDLSQPLSIIGGRPLEGAGSDQEPLVRVSKPEAGEDGDNSVTQYAILGLHSAARMGLTIPRETWQRAHDAVKLWQQEDGGWGYHGDRSYGSMVCAGIGSLTLCRFHLGEADPAADPALERGLGWLDAKFTVRENPGYGESWLYYYLYGMERVGRILDTEFIGDHEWYPFGTKFLVQKQEPDGKWAEQGHAPEQPTSFALLFLTRATPTLSVAKRTGPGTLKTELAQPKGHRVYIILDSTGTMMDLTDGAPRAQTAREAMAKLVAELPDNTEVGVRAFGHRKTVLQEGADTDTELVVPLQKLDRKAVVDKINGLRARGKTPLSLTLQEATKDLKGSASRERPVTVVLVTDGGGDNTRPKIHPLKAVEELGKLPGVSLYVVGFDVKDPDWRQQLTDLSTKGRGRYLNADRADALLRELRTAVFRIPDEIVVADAAGKRVLSGPFGQAATLREGKYTVSTSLQGLTFTREAWVNAGSTTVARFDPIRVDLSQAPAAAPTAAPAVQVPAAQSPVAPAAPASPPAAQPPAGRPKFCTNCGKPLPATGKFCTHCGTKVPE